MEKIQLASFPNNSILLTCFDEDSVNEIEKLLNIKLKKQFYWQHWFNDDYNLNELTKILSGVFKNISEHWGEGIKTMRSFN